MFEPLWGWPPPVLDPAGPYASSVTVLAWVVLGLGLAMTGLVIAALYVALKGPPRLRARLGGEAVVWIGGVAFPAVILTGLLVWSLLLTSSLTRDISGNEMRIRVTGEMWWFRVQYLDGSGEVLIEDANEIHIPAGEPVVLELRSADVIHSFWVPNLSGKKDMIPGRTTLLRVQANRPGRYGGACAEYCGGPHALMGFVTVAHDAEDWGEWLGSRLTPRLPSVPRPVVPEVELPEEEALIEDEEALVGEDGAIELAAAEGEDGETPDEEASGDSVEEGEEDELAPPPPPPPPPVLVETDADRGARLFISSGCAACHRVAGTEANGRAGPDLSHVASRLTLGAGILPNNRGTMIGLIGDSQSIKPGNRMPSYDMLSAEELRLIAIFLEEQK